GEGPARGYLATQAGILNIGGQVAFEGKLPSTAMPAFYHTIDVLVLPSRTRPNWKEQFGRVLIEAMACGVPVIGTTSGAIPWVIGDAGLLVPEDDEDALRGALRSLITDRSLYARLSHMGRQRVLEHFTMEQIAQQTVAVYRQMAG
ncbi:MAG: glycosyltransferase family 4 protein, partial [Chloroflexi bacterium]|nr:glycosyltransferase family 4 protein [Chloroflexota bacterium]